MKDVYKIKDLDQVRLLSDPLKLRLVQAFAESAKTTKQVAAELGTSEKTIKVHRGRVMQKMEADSLADLVRMGELLGIRGSTDTD